VHKGAKNKEQRTQIKYTSMNGVPYCQACKSSQHFVLPLISLDGVSSLCVWRCGLLLVIPGFLI
jgi:hypothetical protein